MTIGRIPSVEGGIQPTIVDAKGDILTATAADTPAVLAVGSNGETLVADSSATTGLRWQEPKAGNPVINSAFQIWQRGTSGAANYVYTADRWMAGRSGGVSGLTVSRQVTNDTTNLPFIQYCARVQRDSGNTGTQTITIGQPFETVNSIPFAGKAVVLSFYARKGANYTATSDALGVKLDTGTGTDQNGLNSAYTGGASPINATATLTTTWQRFSFTGTLASTANELVIYFNYTPVGTASTNDWFEITGVQLEAGSVATPFRTQGVTLAGELAACQRYYLNFSITAAPAYILNGIARSTTLASCYFSSPVEMRVVPTSIDVSGFRIYNSQNGTAYTGGTTTLEAYNNKVFQVNYTHGSAVFTNGTSILGGFDATSSYLRFNAEL